LKHPKIAIITKSMLVGYGVDEIVNFLANELWQKGFDITVVTTKNEYVNHKYKTVSYTVPVLKPLNEFWDSNFLIDLRSFLVFRSVLSQYDVIITVDPMHVVGALSRMLFRKKVLMYYFGVPPMRALDSFTRKVESVRQSFLWNLSFCFSNSLVANSFYTKNLVYPLLRERVSINYHGVEHLVSEDKRAVAQLRENLGVRDGKLILSVGRFSTPYKGMADVLRLFNLLGEKHRDVFLLLVGRGSVNDLGIQSPPSNVRILVNVPFETLRICFKACDIYCTCSRWEGFDIPLVAAQANGKPVIAYNVGAHSEVVANGETGFLVGNVAEFLDRLRLLVKDNELRNKMGEDAKTATRIFTWRRSALNFQKMINQLLSES
jgi:glycosyltransferase involved in cell wall biosynthesis